MTPWYEKSFGKMYLDVYKHRDTVEAESDIGSIVKLIRPDKHEPLLDLACGAGRHLLALHRIGFSKLVGLDLSIELLEEARRILPDRSGGMLELVRGDMRHIPHNGVFKTVLSLFTSFGYFDQDRENERTLRSVRQSMQQGGVFLIDYINSSYAVANLVEDEEQVLPDMRIINHRSLTPDMKRIEKRIEVLRSNGERMEFLESVRLYSSVELAGMLEEAGFENVCCYGSLDGREFTTASERLIVVAGNEECLD
jgi:ubiquinone/menaquinone biosynthesis C-methylase UbiE